MAELAVRSVRRALPWRAVRAAVGRVWAAAGERARDEQPSTTRAGTVGVQLMPLVAAVVVVTTVGCVATETGNPPLAPSVDLAAVRSLGGIGPTGPTGEPPTALEVVGDAGAVAAAGGELWAWNVSSGEPGVGGEVQADGSFGLVVPASHFDTVRLQLVTPKALGEPVDVQFDLATGDARLAPVPCLSVGEANVVATFEQEVDVRFVSQCSGALREVSASLSSGDGEWAVGDGPPAQLEPGAVIALRLRAPPGEAAPELLTVRGVTPDGAAVVAAVSLHVRSRGR